MSLPVLVCGAQREVPEGKGCLCVALYRELACHLGVLLLCFLVCFDVFDVCFLATRPSPGGLLVCFQAELQREETVGAQGLLPRSEREAGFPLCVFPLDNSFTAAHTRRRDVTLSPSIQSLIYLLY